MTVTELIAILQTKNPEAPVWLWHGATGGTEELECAIGDSVPLGEAVLGCPPVLLIGATKKT